LILLRLQHEGVVAVGRKANPVAFHSRHEAHRQVPVGASRSTLPTIGLGEFQSMTFYLVDSADMDAVRADNFHVFANAACKHHCLSS
jgi:hypothetical protein